MRIKKSTTKPKKLRKLLAVLLASGFMTVAGINTANADTTLTPILDAIRQRTYNLVTADTATYTLSDSGSVKVILDASTTKYYTPTIATGYTLADYQNLANTGGGAISKSTSAVSNVINLQLGSDFYSYNKDNLPVSAYTITGPNDPAASGDISIGGKYYSIDLKAPVDKTGTGHVTYKIDDSSGTPTGNVAVSIPDGKTQTIYYTYNQGTYTTETSRVNHPEGSITNKSFQGIETTEERRGGVIENNSTLGNITSDFKGNSVVSNNN